MFGSTFHTLQVVVNSVSEVREKENFEVNQRNEELEDLNGLVMLI